MQLQQQTANSDDFQEISQDEKEALKRKHSMDDVLENKICDLYDLYVEVLRFPTFKWSFLFGGSIILHCFILLFQRLEEDSGPPVRRLYEEVISIRFMLLYLELVKCVHYHVCEVVICSPWIYAHIFLLINLSSIKARGFLVSIVMMTGIAMELGSILFSEMESRKVFPQLGSLDDLSSVIV